jgi:hypothetical protein
MILDVQLYVRHSRAFDWNVTTGQSLAVSPWFVLPIEKPDLADASQLTGA